MASNSVMATCTTAQWTFNSLGQSPCVVGSALAGVCVGGDFTLTPLSPDFVYLGPTVAAATSCRCSSVYYSMLSACAACQGRDFIQWSRYSTNCTTVYSTVFPQPIPSGIAVPHWAYLDVESQNTFNVTLAQAAGGAETIALPSATAGLPTGAPTGVNSPSGVTTGPKKTNVGAIAGGVVGGIVGLALIALIVVFVLRRNKAKKTPPSALYGGVPIPQSSPPPMSYGDGSTAYPSIPSPKPYNPQDPSTFPYQQTYTPPPQNGQNNYYAQGPQNNFIPPNVTGQSSQSGYTQTHTLLNSPSSNPKYTGAPEL